MSLCKRQHMAFWLEAVCESKGGDKVSVCAGSYFLQGNVQVEKGIKHSVIFIYYSFQVDNVQWVFFCYQLIERKVATS